MRVQPRPYKVLQPESVPLNVVTGPSGRVRDVTVSRAHLLLFTLDELIVLVPARGYRASCAVFAGT